MGALGKLQRDESSYPIRMDRYRFEIWNAGWHAGWHAAKEGSVSGKHAITMRLTSTMSSGPTTETYSIPWTAFPSGLPSLVTDGRLVSSASGKWLARKRQTKAPMR